MNPKQPRSSNKVLPIAGPWITDLEIKYVNDAMQTAWYEDHAKYHEKFESAFASYLSRKHVMATSSCTASIHLALKSLGVGPGDEVIVPDITWIATVAPVVYLGATPLFADINPETWCICPESIENLLSPRTRAVVIVDLYGNMPDMEKIMALAKEKEFSVIEDAAEAIGSRFKERLAGGFGEISVFSFHGTKTLTTGEGGLLAMDDDDLFERCKYYGDHCRIPGDKMFWNGDVGFKYKMSAMQAALGLGQLERINELIQKKRDIFNWYQEELRDVNQITLNPAINGVENSYWMVTAIIDERLRIGKEKLIEQLQAKGISTRPFFYPLSSMPPFTNTPPGQRAALENSNSYRISKYGINLPSAFNLDREDVIRVCDQLKELLSQKRRSYLQG